MAHLNFLWCLVIICIVVIDVYSSLELSYLNSYGILCSSHKSIRPILLSSFEFIGATKMKSPEVNTCASLFLNNCGTFPYKWYVYKVTFIWRYFVKGGIFGLYMRISGKVYIHITFLVVNLIVSASEFKLIINSNAINYLVTQCCLSQVTYPITIYRWVGVFVFPISVITSLTSFNSWFIFTYLAI